MKEEENISRANRCEADSKPGAEAARAAGLGRPFPIQLQTEPAPARYVAHTV